MGQQRYDIFISYRRESFNQANLICTRLKALGYRVFIDVEALNSGKFNEQLLSVIKNCKDFIAVLPPNALDRCVSEDDWVRREVMCAMENKRNIIPIMLAGFAWPDPMPKGMEDLCMYQSLAPMPDVYFDMQIKKLQGYLKSKAHYMKRRRWIIGVSIAFAVLAVLFGIAQMTYMPMARKLADSLMMRTQDMVNYDEINTSAYNEWLEYLNAFSKSTSKEEKEESKQMFLKNLHLLEKESNDLLKLIQTDKIEVSGLHLPLLWMHGISPFDVLLLDAYIESCFDDLFHTFNQYKAIIEENNYYAPHLSMAKLGYVLNQTSVESYYYSFLQIMTHLPESMQEDFYKLSLKWENMPKTGLGLSDKEYERLINMTAEKWEKQLNEHKRLKEEAENLLDIINAQLENMLKEE